MSETSEYTGAPQFIHACRCLDNLWMAINAISHLSGRKAKGLMKLLQRVRDEFAREILPEVLKRETPEEPSQ